MSEPRMTKGRALVRCESGHDIWGGETEEEARKHVARWCRECEANPDENFIHYTPPRVIPPSEADTLRAENAQLKARVAALEEAVETSLARCKYQCTADSFCGRCEPLIEARAALAGARKEGAE